MKGAVREREESSGNFFGEVSCNLNDFDDM